MYMIYINGQRGQEIKEVMNSNLYNIFRVLIYVHNIN